MTGCFMRMRYTACLTLAMVLSGAMADATFDKLIAGGQFKEAIEHADNNIPAPSRTADIWVKLGQANESIGLTEKALACYLVGWRMDAGNYGALLGAAKIHNKLNQPDNALTMAKKALEINFSAEASWEYASASIKLKKPQEAKKALEKVIESDPNNLIANRELGNIYYADKEYAKAIGLLRKSYDAGKDANTALKIANSYREVNNMDSALAFMEIALKGGLKSPEVVMDLARIYFGRKEYAEAVKRYAEAIGKAKTEPVDYYNYAVAREATNDARGALDAYRRAVSAYGKSIAKEAVQANLKVAVAAFEAKQFPVSLTHLQFIQSADKTEQIVPNINFLLADVYQALNKSPEAISSLEKAIAKDTRNYEAYARLAGLYEKSGQADKARQTYEQMLKLSPNDPKVFLVLGMYNLGQKKYQEALDLLLKSSELSATAESEEGIAIASINLNQWNRAREAARSAIGKNPELIESRRILTRIYLRAEEWSDARKHLEVLVQKFPREMEYLRQLAQCLEALKDAKALADVDRQIVTLDKSDVAARVRLARFLMAQNKPEEAYELYRAVSVLSPKDSDVLLQLFEIAVKIDKKPEAIIWVKRYLELKPNDAERHRDLGNLEYEAKNWSGALASYRRALKLEPGLKGFYKQYADVVLRQGEPGEVVTALTTLIERGQADMSAYTTLGSIYEKQKQFSKAMDIYRQALAIEPQNTDVLSAYASSQASTGDINNAIITYQQVVMMNPKATDSYKALGDLYTKQKRVDDAMKNYMAYLDAGVVDQAVAGQVGRYGIDQGKYDIAYKYLSSIKGEAANETGYLRVFGEAAFHVEKYEECISAYRRLLERNPQPAERRRLLGILAEAYEKGGKNVDAARAYAEFNKLAGGKNANAAYKSAFLQETANPAAAAKIYEQNTKTFPRDARNFLRLGLMYSRDKTKLSSSVAMLKTAASLADTVPQVWLELAAVYGRLGNEDEEFNAYRQFAKSDAQNVAANKRMGLILMGKGQITNAMVYLETANALSPDDPEVMVALAEGYVRTNRQKEAADLLTKVKEKQPQNVDVRFNLYQLYRGAGRLPEAERELAGIIAINRDNEFLKARAELLMEMGKLKEALEEVENVLATDPENIPVQMLKAQLMRANKKYGEAIEIYKEISYIDPNYAEALYERAETHMLEGKIQWASTFYNRALRADANSALAELGLAKIAKLAKNRVQYMTHLEKAYKMDPKNPQIAEEYRSAKK